jgi:hypothetical protein
MIVNKNDTVFFIGAIIAKIPTGSNGFLMERSEKRLLDVIRDGHVILDSIEAAEDNIEETYLSWGQRQSSRHERGR